MKLCLRSPAAWAALLILLLGAAVPLSTSGCATFGGSPRGERKARMEASGRYREGRFENPEPTQLMNGGKAWDALGEYLQSKGTLRAPNCALPLDTQTASRLKALPSSGLRITWLGHSTTLIELDGRRILTDPVWSDRASPASFAGPKRFHPTPLPLADLPALDAVVISHDHYDHLDMATVRALAQRGTPFHVGLGVGAHLEAWGVPPQQIIEHDWWEGTPLGGGVQLVSTPSRHLSGRAVVDANHTLWTSWALVGPAHRVFFSGDTGYTEFFQTIREKLGPFDAALLEIGQWHPSWGQIHLGPRGALKAHQDLGAQVLFPIHWATFQLGLHDWSEPPETLVKGAEAQGVSVVTPLLGGSWDPADGVHTARWWRAYPPLAPHCPRGSELAQRSLDDWAL